MIIAFSPFMTIIGLTTRSTIVTRSHSVFPFLPESELNSIWFPFLFCPSPENYNRVHPTYPLNFLPLYYSHMAKNKKGMSIPKWYNLFHSKSLTILWKSTFYKNREYFFKLPGKHVFKAFSTLECNLTLLNLCPRTLFVCLWCREFNISN